MIPKPIRYRIPAAARTDGEHWVLTIDPGGKRSGYALWHGRTRQLRHAGHFTVPALISLLIVLQIPPKRIALLYEVPHQRGDGRAQQSGIQALLDTIEALRGAMAWGARRGYRPRKWKGSAPKPVVWSRCDVVLTEDERAIAGLDPEAENHQPDKADAVAFGLWALGRTDRGGAHGRPQESS